MSVGSLSVKGNSFDFLSINFPSGHPEDRAILQAEELITPGIDGRRWRTVYKQFPSFPMTTTLEATDYAAAVKIKQRAENLVQKLVNLSVATSGGNFLYREVHVSAVQVRLFPGPVVGSGTSNGAAHLEITWQLELTDSGSAQQ